MTEPTGGPPPPSTPAAGWDLHPLSMGRILQLTFGMLRFRWRAVFGAVLLPLLPAHVIAAIIQAPFAQRLNSWLLENQGPRQPTMFRLPPGWGEAVLVVVVTSIALALVSLVATAAVTWVAGETYAGRRTSAVAALRHGLRRLGSVVGAHLLYFVTIVVVMITGLALAAAFFIGQAGGGVMAFLGLVVVVAAVAAVIFVLIRWSLVMPVLMLENRGAMEALGRSWRLVAGSGWRVLGYLVLLGLLVGLTGSLVVELLLLLAAGGGVTVDAGRLVAQSLIAGLVTTLLAPVTPLAMTLLYLDIRWRRGEAPADRPLV